MVVIQHRFHICTNPISCGALTQACVPMLHKLEPTWLESIGYTFQIGVILDDNLHYLSLEISGDIEENSCNLTLLKMIISCGFFAFFFFFGSVVCTPLHHTVL